MYVRRTGEEKQYLEKVCTFCKLWNLIVVYKMFVI